MKRIVYLFVAVLLFASCEKNEIGSTATESLSGQWYVNVDAVDENGNVVYTGAEFFEFYNNFLILTYNTSDNDQDVMFIDDLKNFWTFKSKVDCSTSSLTFSMPDVEKYIYATTYDPSESTSTNNYYFHAGKFDAEMWQSYQVGVKQYYDGLIKKDSLEKLLAEYYEVADDTISAGYFVKCQGLDYEVGVKKGEDDIENFCNITITDGKILKGAATTPSGMPADSIVFYVEFDDDYTLDDEGNVVYAPEYYGFKNYRVSGYRYTGFTNDD